METTEGVGQNSRSPDNGKPVEYLDSSQMSYWVYHVLHRNRLKTFSSVVNSFEEGLRQIILKINVYYKSIRKNSGRGRSLILLGYSNQD
jgi:hypothetical protein